MSARNFIQDLKSFALRGNVMDMAVGIIIGAAFGKIVSSLVSDVIMPPVGLLLGGVNFTELKWELSPAHVTDGVEHAAVTINYGSFLQCVLDFSVIVLAIFLMVKIVSGMRRKKAAADVEKTAPTLSREEELLTEIRDLLKK